MKCIWRCDPNFFWSDIFLGKDRYRTQCGHTIDAKDIAFVKPNSIQCPFCKNWVESEGAFNDNPKDRQCAGNHYDMPIQPIEFILANDLGYCEGNVIKYICRYKRKGGVEDLEKAKHYIDFLIDSFDRGGKR